MVPPVRRSLRWKLVLGLPTEELNTYLQAYADSLPADKHARCSLANSVWFRDDADHLTVEQAFWTSAPTITAPTCSRPPLIILP